MNSACSLLRRHYGSHIGSHFALRPAGSAAGNSHVFFVSLGAAMPPRFVLKAIPCTDVHDRWQNMLDLQRTVAGREPLAAPVVPTDDSRPAVRWDGWLWRLLGYRPGSGFRGERDELVAAASGLARLHLAMRTLDGPAVSHRYDFLTEGERSTVLASTVPNAEAAAFWERVRYLVGDVLPRHQERLVAIDRNGRLPRQLVHGDFHPGNVVFEGGRISGILDLDSLTYDFRMQDVAFAASRFSSGRRENFDAFLEAYHAIDPLLADEQRLAGDFVRREAARRLHWIIRTNVIDGIHAWRHDLEKHAAVLEGPSDFQETILPRPGSDSR